MNYREIINKNRYKTKIALFLYLLIYIFIGFLLDIVISNSTSMTDTLYKIIHLEQLPIATISMLLFGFVSIIVSIFFFERIQLSGESYVKIEKDNKEYKDLYNILEELKIAAGLKYMPKLYVIKASYMNAFASGWNEKNTMIAITEGLYEKLNRAELSAVIGHELTHIRNEDIKLTLVVGVVTNIMLFVTDWISFIIFRGNNNDGAKSAKLILLVLHFVLPILTLVIQMWLSRSREYMADAGSVELIRDPKAMASALKKISLDYHANDYHDNNVTRKAAYIFEKGDNLFSTHPSIKNRIKKLGF